MFYTGIDWVVVVLRLFLRYRCRVSSWPSGTQRLLVPDGMHADHTTTHCDVLLPLTASSTGAKSCASAELEAAGVGKVKKASIMLLGR